MQRPSVDLRFENHLELVLLRPISKRAAIWMAENLKAEPYQWMGGALAMDQQSAANIYPTVRAAGFVVSAIDIGEVEAV